MLEGVSFTGPLGLGKSRLTYRLIKETKLSEQEAALVHALWLLRDGSDGDGKKTNGKSEGDHLTASHDPSRPPALSARANAADLEILRASCDDLVEAMTRREARWSAVAVVKAFAREALRLHRETNCLTEIMIEQALKEAEARDEYLRETGHGVGPLHGLPVSLKDQFHCKSFDSSLGISSLANRPATRDGDYATLLKGLGAIPFVKTNVPQLMMAFECGGTLFGRTTSVYNPRFIPGGSSGGEGALVGGGGSAFGIGSDIGGSIRIPAHFSGCYGLKPTAKRWCTRGAQGLVAGFEGVNSTPGPMTRSWRDLELVTRTMMAAMPRLAMRDPAMLPMPWRAEAVEKMARKTMLKIGYYKSDGLFLASPACQRAVQETVDALRAKGHQCTEVELPNPVRGATLWVGLTSADGHATLKESLAKNNDPLDPSLWLMINAVYIPRFVILLLVFLLHLKPVVRLLGLSGVDGTFAAFAQASRVKSTREYLRWVAKRDEYRHEFAQWLMGEDDANQNQEARFDCLLGPVQCSPAIEHGRTARISSVAAATFLYNLLDLPALVIPVTQVKPSDVFAAPERPPAKWGFVERELYGPLDWRGRAPRPEHPRAVYSAQRMQGLPVGVQVVGTGRFKDEEVLGCGRLIEAALPDRSWLKSRHGA